MLRFSRPVFEKKSRPPDSVSDPDSMVSGSGSKRGNTISQKLKKISKISCFEVLDVLLLGAEAFLCSLDVLGIGGKFKLQFLIQKKEYGSETLQAPEELVGSFYRPRGFFFQDYSFTYWFSFFLYCYSQSRGVKL